MDENCDLRRLNVNEKAPIMRVTKTGKDKRSNKCNQCDYGSSHSGHFKTHLKTHSGEKSHKCNQCDFASSQASSLKVRLKTHRGEKSNKCN